VDLFKKKDGVDFKVTIKSKFGVDITLSDEQVLFLKTVEVLLKSSGYAAQYHPN
jgi:hypothetical protein